MPCYGPLTAYRPKSDAPDRRLVFKKSDSETGIGIKIPCGKCPGCKLEQSRQWAVRCMHEKRLNSASCFITLTYDDHNLPNDRALVRSDLTKFLKRCWHINNRLRYFACGEYGETTDRPHYHVLLLDTDFMDKKLIKSGSQYNLYASSVLSKLWQKGNHALGDVSFESAAYVARYCMKKRQNGKTRTDGKTPEYIVMSRRPGLGTGYFTKYKNEIINHDTIIVNGLPAALPRFYDSMLEKEYAGLTDKLGFYTKMELVKLKRRRKLTSPQSRADRSQRRLRIREVVTLAKLKLKAKTL